MVKKSFSKTIIHHTTLPKDKEDLMVLFMLSNITDIFKVGDQTPAHIEPPSFEPLPFGAHVGLKVWAEFEGI